jgi:hypothetical protein
MDPLATNKLTDSDFVTVKPLKGAEFIVRVDTIQELNEAWEGKPALIFMHEPGNPAKVGSIAISEDEYYKLKYLLTGDLRVDPEELRRMYEEATARKEPPKKAAPNKETAKK